MLGTEPGPPACEMCRQCIELAPSGSTDHFVFPSAAAIVHRRPELSLIAPNEASVLMVRRAGKVVTKADDA